MALHIHKLPQAPRARATSVSTIVLICVATLVIHLVLWNNPRTVRYVEASREGGPPAEPDADVPRQPVHVGGNDEDEVMNEKEQSTDEGVNEKLRPADDVALREEDHSGGKEEVPEEKNETERTEAEEDDADSLEDSDSDFEPVDADTVDEGDLVAEKGVVPAEKRSCESEEYVFDANNKTCVPKLTAKLKSQSMYFSNQPDARYLYCAIPKNGCTYHLGLMWRISGAERWGAGGQVHNPEQKGAHQLDRKDISEIESIFADETLPKYLVVRNPITRTLSGYLDKVEKEFPAGQRTAETFHKWIYEMFPLINGKKYWPKMNPHWRPQTRFCGFHLRDLYRYFRVFRVEDPEHYVDFLYQHVPRRFLDDGWSENKSFRESVLGPRKRTRHTDEKVLYYFSNVTVFDYLADVLSEDVKRLGYTDEVKKIREDIVADLEGKS